MQAHTRNKVNEYAAQQAKLNAVSNVAETFNVAPNVEQTLIDRIGEDANFLQGINLILVTEQKGQSLGISTTPNAARTNTKVNDRVPKQITNVDNIDSYDCIKTEFDVAIPWSLLDAWAHKPEFQKLIMNRITTQMAIDKLTVGFHGTSRAEQSNRAANPLGEDINIGWIGKLANDSQRCMTNVTYGADQEYKNLDAIVFDAIGSLIDPWHQKSADIKVICNQNTLKLKYFDMINTIAVATDKEAINRLMAQFTLGLRQVEICTQMADNDLLITSLDNMSLYTQRSSTRRYIRDNPNRDQLEIFNSQNDDYVYEDKGKACLIRLAPHKH